MNTMTTKQASELWGITPRRIALLCEQGRVSGASKAGKTWLIPFGTQKPEDARLSADNDGTVLKNGTYYLEKIREQNYSLELQKCIEEACRFCLAAVSTVSEEMKKNQPLMMLGKIQSGKTRAFIGLMALSFDNDFDLVLILTKNSQALVKQTYKRMRQEFRRAISDDEIEIFDIMKTYNDFEDYELEKKMIIVAKKETRNLDRIIEFINEYMLHQGKNCLIIDDEADTTGIGFTKVKDSVDEFDLRTVASKVNDVRGNLEGCVFVQVTATPYALYLQPEFNEMSIEPIKPKSTVLVPSGEGYIGGEYYFLSSQLDNHPARFIFEPISDDENDMVSDQKRKGRKSKLNDRRSFKEENLLTDRGSLETFKKGIVNFIVGGCAMNIIEEKSSKYAYVIHTATQKSSHLKLETIANALKEQIKLRNEATKPIIEAMFAESYYDIERSLIAYGYIMPDIESVRESFYAAITKGCISITVVNSDRDIETILDEDTGELKLRTPFSIFVGGQVLDRGVTIPKMVGFYYGRNPKRMQQDTVMQHSRMFGYRNKALLAITRFYTTRRIHDNMTKLTEFDVSLREDIENGVFKDGIIFIQKHLSYRPTTDGSKIKDEIVPCSPAKIALSNIVLIKPQSRLLPVGFSPTNKIGATKISRAISQSLLKLIPDGQKESTLVTFQDVETIIISIYSAIEADDDTERFVTVERFLSVLRYLAHKEDKIHLFVRRNRQLSKFKHNGTIYQDAPDDGHNELALARQTAIEYPALMLLHQDGTASGWNGSEFWWPVLLAPLNIKRTIYAMPDADGKINE